MLYKFQYFKSGQIHGYNGTFLYLGAIARFNGSQQKVPKNTSANYCTLKEPTSRESVRTKVMGL